MDTPSDRLTVYLELAEHYDLLGQFSMRDRFLMLAADSALAAGQAEDAEGLRQRILSGSRHHMLRPYRSFSEAARAPDVQTYLTDLKANYPPEQARNLLDTLRSGEEPVAAPAARQRSAVPPTAPLFDINARQPSRLADPPAPYPLRQEQSQSQSQPQGRPRPEAPQRSVPVAPLSPMPSVSPSRHQPPESASDGGWFSVVLSFLVVTVALAVAVLVLGRPYLSMDWLR